MVTQGVGLVMQTGSQTTNGAIKPEYGMPGWMELAIPPFAVTQMGSSASYQAYLYRNKRISG